MFLEASVSHLRKAVEPATFQSKFLGSNAVKVKFIASQLTMSKKVHDASCMEETNLA